MQRYAFIDSLRGLAAMYVVVFHMALLPSSAPQIPAAFRSVVMFGGSGVTLFFVVSAFSLCLTMERHLIHRTPAWSYALSRAFRIIPLFYAVLAFFIWFYAWLGGPVKFEVIILNIFMIFNVSPGFETGIVWASWTVGVEVLFYAVFPFLHALLPSLRSKLLGLAASILVAVTFTLVTAIVIADPATRSQFEFFSVFTRAPCFLIGMVAYEVWRIQVARAYRQWLGLVQIACGLIILVACIKIPSVIGVAPDGMTGVYLTYFVASGYAVLLLGISKFPWRLFVNKITQLWGTCSYSIYLWHSPIIWSSSGIYFWIGEKFGPFAFLVSAILTISVMSVVGWISFRLIEAPGIKVGRLVLEKLDRGPK